MSFFLFFFDIIFYYPKKFVPLQMNTGRFSSEFRQWDIEGINNNDMSSYLEDIET